ncbi:MAG: TetR/AcrR family transcriptional regulator [Alphaproteobacteria bacterium]|nr:TetR/AcrR family transcriptional regulator [Alphaproteobacteria bacterium]
MRVRTDEKRGEILEAATEVFRDVGYERASMAMIAERVGGSKTTLYGYYPSKEELFWDAMVGAIKVERGEKTLALLDPDDPDIAAVLERFGRAYVPLFTARENMAVTRTAIAEATTNRPLSTLLYKRGPKRVLEAVAGYLSQLKKKGAIRDVDPHHAAVHLKALLDGGVIEPLLFGAKAELKADDAVRAAVDIFLRAYQA